MRVLMSNADAPITSTCMRFMRLNIDRWVRSASAIRFLLHVWETDAWLISIMLHSIIPEYVPVSNFVMGVFVSKACRPVLPQRLPAHPPVHSIRTTSRKVCSCLARSCMQTQSSGVLFNAIPNPSAMRSGSHSRRRFQVCG